MKLELRNAKFVPLQEFLDNVKSSVVALNNNDHEEVVVTKGDKVPFLIMMKYGKLQTMVDNAVRRQIQEIDSVVARSVRNVNLQQLTKAQQNLLKIRSKLVCFDNMSDEDVINVTKDVEFLQFNRKEMLFDQGHSGDTVFYVMRGMIKVFAHHQHDHDTPFQLLASLGEGSVLGEMSPVTGEPRSARAVAAEDGTIILSFGFEKEMALENKEAMFQLYKNFVKLVSQKLIDTNNRLTAAK